MNLIPTKLLNLIRHRKNLIKIFNNISWLLVDRALRLVMSLLIGVWLARYLGPSQYGLLNFSIAFVSIFGIIAGAGLQSTVVREIINCPEDKGKILGSAAIIILLGGCIAYVLTVFGIFWIRPGDSSAINLVLILAIITLLKISEVAVYWFESQVESKYVVYSQNIAFFLCSALRAALIITGASVFYFAWVNVFEALLVAILLLSVFKMRSGKSETFSFDLEKMRGLLVASWPLMLNGLGIMVYMKTDQIMLGQILNDEAVGIYSSAVRISEAWYFIPTAIASSVLPTIINAKKNSHKQYYSLLQKLIDMMVILSLIVALPMTFLSTFFISFLYGDSYIGAASVLTIHIWTAIFVFIGFAGNIWFIVENKPMLVLERTALGALLNIVLNLVLIPKYGVEGAAFSTLISQFFATWGADLIHKNTRELFFMKLKAFNFILSLRRIFN